VRRARDLRARCLCSYQNGIVTGMKTRLSSAVVAVTAVLAILTAATVLSAQTPARTSAPPSASLVAIAD